MRIHVQNLPEDSHFTITQAQWDEACARAGESGHQVSFADTTETGRKAMRDAEAVVTQASAAKPLFPADAPALKMVFCTSAGLDRMVPLDWLPPGVELLNNRGAHGGKAGEFGIMAILMLANKMPILLANQREQRWEKHHASVLAGRRVTVVGLGALGAGTAANAKLFGMDVTGVRTRPEPHPSCDRVVGVDTLDQVLPDTEFLVLATPLTDATRNLLDASRIALLPKHAGVINVGRGGLVEQDALCDALDSGRLAGAVLDVFVPEPVPPGHRLWTTRNLVMTPHCCADDPSTYNPASLDIFFKNLAAYRAGQPMPNRFDPERGY